MKFLKPNLVSGEILNLLDEATKKVIIVSPYCKFDKWYRLTKKIKDLKSRNVEVEFYIREGEQESYDQIINIGITPICIPNLHSKMYLNEKYGIVTSMNLLLSSEINSIEIGYKTETKEELNELLDFYSTYLNKAAKSPEAEIKENTIHWLQKLEEKLSERFKKVKIFENERNVVIKTSSNTYDIFIWSHKGINKLRISGILSGKEYEYIKFSGNNIQIKDMKLEFIEGGKYYDSVWGTFEIELKSFTMKQLKSTDSKIIIAPIIDFISKIEEIKDYCYQKRNEL